MLLDTHVVVWLALDQSRLSKRARAAIQEARTKAEGLAVSGITLFELATLADKGRIGFNASIESFLQEVETRFSVIPITSRICVQAFKFGTRYPNDPADRLIGATAVVEGLPLLTADSAIRRSKALPTIW